jgi:hypothetical protein
MPGEEDPLARLLPVHGRGGGTRILDRQREELQLEPCLGRTDGDGGRRKLTLT